MNLRRYFFTLLVVLPLSSPLSAQETEEDDKFLSRFCWISRFPIQPEGANWGTVLKLEPV